MLDLSQPLRLHVVGAGGSGMSAIASVLAAMGHTVSGSDLKDGPALQRLRARGVRVAIGHDAANLGDAEFLAVSTAIPASNPEIVAAEAGGLTVLRRADVLAAIAAARRTIAISGTHGKTTTSSMLALVLAAAGLRPSFIVGGELNEIGGGAVWDQGDWFVVEADESDGTFVALPAEIAVATSIEPDHLDHYGSFAAIEEAFDQFLAQASGPTVVCADDPVADRLGRAHGSVRYGVAEDADYRIVDAISDREGVRFTLLHEGSPLGDLTLPIPGMHNARNATAAVVAALLVGVSFDDARIALARYAGVARRFQYRGEHGGITFVDDYAHNPGKVRAVLEAAASGEWRRLVCVFQPHRYSRTAALWRDFGDSFTPADLIVITDVYGAGEAPRPGVTGKLIVDAVLDRHPWKRVAYLPRRSDVVPYLVSELRPGDLCLTIGAGDVTGLPDEILDGLARSAPRSRSAR